MMMHRRTACAALLLLAASACTRHRAPDPTPAPAPGEPVVFGADTASRATVREYRGTYSSGYEISWFEACGAPRGDGTWWVTLTEDARLQRDSLVRQLASRPTGGVAVRWRGTVGPRMRAGAGHMGRGTRYLLVTEILSLRPLEEAGDPCRGRDA
ncbi:MAG: hypothetical protein JWL60_1425 [Gemmatimonadetes bacterium]|nr:hypothetical protein [Gemmatimonadota bacterium]